VPAGRVCKRCRSNPQRQRAGNALLLWTLPADYRISGVAIGVTRTLSRTVDGDWFEIRKGRMRPLWADDIETRLLVSGAREITRILEDSKHE